MRTGFDHLTDDELRQHVTNLRNGITRMVNDPNSLKSTTGHKEGSPAGGFPMARALLKHLEDIMIERDLDILAEGMGFDWTPVLNDISEGMN